MANDMTPMDQDRLWDAANRVQNFLTMQAPNPGDGTGIAAMILVNLLASGIACGALREEGLAQVMEGLLDSVRDTVNAINEGMAAEAASGTIQ
jgi:hypothetical protein